jgi:dihydropteroate synthase
MLALVRYVSKIPPTTWTFSGRTTQFAPAAGSLPLFMGIVNTTPDSFSDGGMFLEHTSAVDHALRLIDDGADIIDIGGQSTRPGSDAVRLDEELHRVMPVVEGLRRRRDVPISVDTSKAEVARQAIAAGAQIINDVTSLRDDPAMIDVVADSNAGVVIMHMLGTPATMQDNPTYGDVVSEVTAFLAERLEWLASRGVAAERVAVDPGIGFGKRVEHNLRLLRELEPLARLGRPILIGPSRKNLIGRVLNRPIGQRVFGTVGACVACFLRGAHILRVHDVAAVRDAVLVAHAIEQARPSP